MNKQSELLQEHLQLLQEPFIFDLVGAGDQHMKISSNQNPSFQQLARAQMGKISSPTFTEYLSSPTRWKKKANRTQMLAHLDVKALLS